MRWILFAGSGRVQAPIALGGFTGLFVRNIEPHNVFGMSFAEYTMIRGTASHCSTRWPVPRTQTTKMVAIGAYDEQVIKKVLNMHKKQY